MRARGLDLRFREEHPRLYPFCCFKTARSDIMSCKHDAPSTSSREADTHGECTWQILMIFRNRYT